MEPMMYDEFLTRKKKCEELDQDNTLGLTQQPDCFILGEKELIRAKSLYLPNDNIKVLGGYMDQTSIYIYYTLPTHKAIICFVKHDPSLEDLNFIGGYYE